MRQAINAFPICLAARLTCSLSKNKATRIPNLSKTCFLFIVLLIGTFASPGLAQDVPPVGPGHPTGTCTDYEGHNFPCREGGKSSMKEQLQRLNQRISEVNDSINKPPADAASLKSLYEQLDAARLDYRSFEDALYGAHPELRIRSGQTTPLTIDDIKALTLAGDTAYLEYVVTETGVSVFVLRRSEATGRADVTRYVLATKPEDLARKVNQFHDRLANRHPDYSGFARELYSTLIESAAKQIEGASTICIIPDSFLWNVPFQALMPANNHFLIEDHALYYAPSLSVLREINREKSAGDKTDSSLIAFGNPVIDKDEQRNADLCPLPEAEQEVNSIAKSLAAKSSKVFIGRDATEKTFKALAPTYSILHLATHGVIDNRQPLYSHLMLTRTDADPENDGILQAREIMDLSLRADLAVLSACETANGRISPGEGVTGMSWAFFMGGTRSIVVSEWKVNSVSTSHFMITFYQALNSGLKESSGKTEAMQSAALKLMREPGYRHPFYWAPFVMIGSNRKVN